MSELNATGTVAAQDVVAAADAEEQMNAEKLNHWYSKRPLIKIR